MADKICAVKISINCSLNREKVVLGLRKTFGPDNSEYFQELEGMQ